MPANHNSNVNIGPRLDQRASSLLGPRKLRRCLGPAPQEHSFLSAWPGERVCRACRERQRVMNINPRFVVPVASVPPPMV